MEIGGAFMISCEYGESNKWEHIPLEWCSNFGMPDWVKKIMPFIECLLSAKHCVIILRALS